MNFNYIPILKTTDAELKGYFFLDNVIKDSILPLFEITRSRRSTKNPDGNIQKRLESLKSMTAGRICILDVTSETTLQNKQTANLLLSDNGFANWVTLIKDLDFKVIPCIQYTGDTDENFRKQVDSLFKLSNQLALRAPIVTDISNILEPILNIVGDRELILIFDSKFCPLNSLDSVSELSISEIKKLSPLLEKRSKTKVVLSSSSFPKTVIATGYGKGDAGEFLIGERLLFEKVSKAIEQKLVYSDYGSIHPQRYEDFGKWIPRIDYPLDNLIFYYRYRQEKGGYVTAANSVISDKRYKPIKSIDAWGDQEIIQAATGSPNGRSPSHWIAVRLNLHITRQALNPLS